VNDTFKTLLGNSQTTGIGGVSGGAVIISALQIDDLATKITGIIIGVGMIVLGVFAKDATTGTKP
jgi:hypothetical protein